MNAKQRSKRQLCWGTVLGITVCFGIMVPQTVWGGNLNANEAELMGIARGTFTYEGVTYRAKEAYINEAYYYLIRDDVDVTDEQKASAIQQVYASVKQGIDEGYLYPVSETEAETTGTEAGTQTEEISQNVNQEAGNSVLQDSPSIDEEKDQDIEEPTGSALLGFEESDIEQPMPQETEPEPEIIKTPQAEALEHISEFLKDRETETVSYLQLFPENKSIYSLEDILNVSNWLIGIFSGILGISLIFALKEKLFIHHHRKSKKKGEHLRE